MSCSCLLGHSEAFELDVFLAIASLACCCGENGELRRLLGVADFAILLGLLPPRPPFFFVLFSLERGDPAAAQVRGLLCVFLLLPQSLVTECESVSAAFLGAVILVVRVEVPLLFFRGHLRPLDHVLVIALAHVLPIGPLHTALLLWELEVVLRVPIHRGEVAVLAV